MRSPFAILLTCAAFTLCAPVASANNEGLPADLSARIAASISSTFANVVERTHNLVLNAIGFMGIPYRWGGTTPEAGFDCSGFVQFVFKQAAGLVLPRSSFEQIRLGAMVGREELQAGDLVFFNTLHATASHVGIYIGEDRFIHSPRVGKTVAIDSFNDVYWQTRFDGARRLPL